MLVEIDNKSGFCFGVTQAIKKAEEMLLAGETLLALGSIVHNDDEVNRLKLLGLRTIDREVFFELRDCNVLIRAHGEPPETYEYARQNNINLVDGTCPVVLKLQQRVRNASDQAKERSGQVVIFGHPSHAEVIGLVGQATGNAVVVENAGDLSQVDGSRPMTLFSQTTMSVEGFRNLKAELEKKTGREIEAHDTICRQVANRVPHLQEFSARHQVIVFVGGKQSSNARVLFEACKKVNTHTYFVQNPDELDLAWFSRVQTVGVCGATSTPQWLMEAVARKISQS